MKLKYLTFLASFLCICLVACNDSASTSSSYVSSNVKTSSSSSRRASSSSSQREEIISRSRTPIVETSSELSLSSPDDSSSIEEISSISSSSSKETSSSYTPKEYLITWRNYDGKILQQSYEKEGTIPTYNQRTPTHQRTNEDGEFFYTFNSWDKEIQVAESDQTYIATFEKNFLFEMELSNDSYIVKRCLISVDWCTIPREYNGLPVSMIANYTFGECSRIKTLNIPDSVKSIEPSAFFSSRQIGNIPVDTINFYMKNIENWFTFSGKEKLDSTIHLFDESNEEIKSITVPEGTKKIDDYTFNNCSSINYINLPDGLESIGDYAFNKCTYLKEIVFPESLKTIGKYAFCNCRNIRSILIPNQVTSINESAFKMCMQVESIVFGTSLKSIGEYAFYFCRLVETIVVPDNVTYIGAGAFYCCNSLKSLELPFVGMAINGFQYLGSIFGAVSFENTELYDSSEQDVPATLKTVLVGNTCSTIYKWAFRSCVNIETIVFSEGITTFESYIFDNCKKLKSVSIPNSVTSFGHQDFSNQCPKLIYNEYGNGLYLGNDSNPYLVLVSAKNKEIESCVVHENCKIISDYAFYNCKKLSRVTMGKNVTSIGSYSFYNCYYLTSITLPSSLSQIGNNAFRECNKLREVINKSEFSLTKGATTYGYVAYKASYIISDESESVMVYRDDGFVLRGNPDHYNLAGYHGKNRIVVIPDEVAYVDNYAFYGNEYVEAVVVPKTVVSFKTSSILECDNLNYLLFCGTESEWEGVGVPKGFYGNFKGAVYYYSETMPTDENNYWRYVDGNPLPW